MLLLKVEPPCLAFTVFGTVAVALLTSYASNSTVTEVLYGVYFFLLSASIKLPNAFIMPPSSLENVPSSEPCIEMVIGRLVLRK